MQKILIGLSLTFFSLSTYLIWFEKKNVFNHLGVGICFVAYLVPLFILNLRDYASQNTIDLYVMINLIGMISFTIGLFIGYRWKKVLIINAIMKFSIPEKAINSPLLGKKVVLFSKRAYLICLITMIFCFLYMGFLPMFAADPYSAKQFKGIYNIRYHDVALFYRTSKQFIQLLLPLLLIHFLERKNISMLALILCGVALIILSLSRAEAVTGIFLVFSIFITMKGSNKAFFWYMIVMVLIYSLGSSFWVIATYLFPKSGFSTVVDNQSIAAAIASGAPDIPDQLGFLDAFLRNHVDYTYGLTFIGGLVPFNFKWNPSVWTLLVINETNDVSQIPSGGLRLPVSIWGYLCFGWFGVAVIPFFSAFFTGYITRKIKYIVKKLPADTNGYIIFYLLVFLYLNIGIAFIEFYRLSIYLFPAFIFYGLIVNFLNKKPKVKMI